MSHPTGFRSPAYRALVRALGESDATVEWVEVAVRELERVSTTQGQDGVRALAVQHGVHVHPIDLCTLKHRFARLQILAVYQQADHFLQEFRRTHPRSVNYDRSREEDLFSATIRSFNVRPSEIGQLEVDLFQYYREVRNVSMHDPQGEQSKTEKTLCKNLRDRVSASAYCGLNAPNPIEDLAFDDFVLFTRSLKELAANLCSATDPTDDELARCVSRNPKLVAKLKFLGANRSRAVNAIGTFLKARFNIPAEQAKSIVEIVLNGAR